jgi:hypothetical protein
MRELWVVLQDASGRRSSTRFPLREESVEPPYDAGSAQELLDAVAASSYAAIVAAWEAEELSWDEAEPAGDVLDVVDFTYSDGVTYSLPGIPEEDTDAMDEFASLSEDEIGDTAGELVSFDEYGYRRGGTPQDAVRAAVNSGQGSPVEWHPEHTGSRGLRGLL